MKNREKAKKLKSDSEKDDAFQRDQRRFSFEIEYEIKMRKAEETLMNK